MRKPLLNKLLLTGAVLLADPRQARNGEKIVVHVLGELRTTHWMNDALAERYIENVFKR